VTRLRLPVSRCDKSECATACSLICTPSALGLVPVTEYLPAAESLAFERFDSHVSEHIIYRVPESEPDLVRYRSATVPTIGDSIEERPGVYSVRIPQPPVKNAGGDLGELPVHLIRPIDDHLERVGGADQDPNVKLPIMAATNNH
jgi:hypothetical protein